ncbi:hypothetical protein G7046_g7779 [Stylonectria norvegica]|nr:hypothetical protein G7046_g7779 [Stylonectria norvegica]
MSTSSNTQVLIAAFTFGIVVNAASASLFSYAKGNGLSIVRDGPRLALIIFFATTALWAQTVFIATLLNLRATTSCQITIAFASFFDQLARVSLQQGLLWIVNSRNKASTIETALSQGAIFIRVIIGVVLIGFQRPQLDTICLTRTSVAPLGITVITIDALMAIVLSIRAFPAGAVDGFRESKPPLVRNKALLLAVAGLGVWTATSSPMILGISTTVIITRTVIPAAGVFILIVILIFSKDTLIIIIENESNNAPGVATPRNFDSSRDWQSRASSTAEFSTPRSRYDEVKSGRTLTSTISGTSLPAFLGREVKGGLPLVTRPNAGQAVTGIGGVLVQGQLFPPMRAQVASILAGTTDLQGAAPKKWSKEDGTPTISNPVLRQSSQHKISTMIATVDLATAARNKKEQRDWGHQPPHPNQAEMRVTPNPLGVASEDLMRMSQDVKDKRGSAGCSELLGATFASSGAQGSSSGSMAATTSAQLSPGVEEIRRRSPRQLPDEDSGHSQAIKASSLLRKSTAQTLPSTRSLSNTRTLDLSRSKLDNSNVSPSRLESSSFSLERQPKAPENAAKMAYKSGLPSNPRGPATAALVKGKDRAYYSTIMPAGDAAFVDPEAFRAIEYGVGNKRPDQQFAYDLTRATSIVNRPRPIPRKPDVDRALFPAEGSPNLHEHKRSLSNGSARSKMSFIQSAATSPHRIPELPPLPESARNLLRPQPNTTTSMIWNEKMKMFYPDAVGARANSPKSMRRRSSSVPEIPTIPATYVDETFTEEAPQKTNTPKEIGTEADVVAFEGDTSLEQKAPKIQNVLSFSMAAYEGTAVDNLSCMSQSPTQNYRVDEGTTRRSSPVLPDEGLSSSFSTDGRRPDDESSSDWGSVHSSPMTINLQRARAIGVTEAPTSPWKNDETVFNDRAASTISLENGNEIMIVMLDTSASFDAELIRGSEQLQPAYTGMKSSHREIGEICPTFSDRGQAAKLRRVPPPPPLLLNQTDRIPVVAQAELSPLETPRHAMETLQIQLKELEHHSRESTGSEQVARITLLANLEIEMGQQENQWQQMRHDLAMRDSITTFQTSPALSSYHGSARSSIVAPSEGLLRDKTSTEKWASLRVDGDTHSSHFTQGSDMTHAGFRRQRLAVAHQQYVDDQPWPMARTRSGVNSREVASFRLTQLGSPTPPDSECSEDECEALKDDYEGVSEGMSKEGGAVTTLWRPPTNNVATPRDNDPNAFLWTPTSKSSMERLPHTEGPRRQTRITTAMKKGFEPLTIESNHLWEKSVSNRRLSGQGLWRLPASQCASQRASQYARRPALNAGGKTQETKARLATQRPPRRSKRMTVLPDILESPKLLPDKRGTLGIFQFPWGEKSDVGTISPPSHILFMGMPGTMASGGLAINSGAEARARAVEEAEYSTSYFDDYEDETYGDDLLSDYETEFEDEEEDEEGDERGGEGAEMAEKEDESDDYDDDDGFDETTLWEIASLLKSNEVPSRDSLFPARGPAVTGTRKIAKVTEARATTGATGITVPHGLGHGEHTAAAGGLVGAGGGIDFHAEGSEGEGGEDSQEESEGGSEEEGPATVDKCSRGVNGSIDNYYSSKVSVKDNDGEHVRDSIRDLDSDSDDDSESNDDDSISSNSRKEQKYVFLDTTKNFPSPPGSALVRTNYNDVLPHGQPKCEVTPSQDDGRQQGLGGSQQGLDGSQQGPTEAAAESATGPGWCSSWSTTAPAAAGTTTTVAQRLRLCPLESGFHQPEPQSTSLGSATDGPARALDVKAEVCESGLASSLSGGAPMSAVDGADDPPACPTAARSAAAQSPAAQAPAAKSQCSEPCEDPCEDPWRSCWDSSQISQIAQQRGLSSRSTRSSMSVETPPSRDYHSSISQPDDQARLRRRSQRNQSIISPKSETTIYPLPSADSVNDGEEETHIHTHTHTYIRHRSHLLEKPSTPAATASSLWPLHPPISVAIDYFPANLNLSKTHHSPATHSMALWSPATPLPVSSKGLQQPDAAVWNVYLPLTENIVRVAQRQAKPAVVESTALWAPATKTVATLPQDGLWGSHNQQKTMKPLAMWALPPPVEDISYGLPHPEQHIWEAYLPAKADAIRVKPRKSAPAQIASSALWSHPSPMPVISAPTTTSLWGATAFSSTTPITHTNAKSTSTKPSSSSHLPAALNYGMWVSAPAVEHEEPQGLFSVSHKRSDFRNTTQPPAAPRMKRKPRAAPAPFPELGFARLWNEAPLWEKKTPVIDVVDEEANQVEGLFSLNHGRVHFRVTSAAPAGLKMTRKPRVSNEPLPKLTSDSLWSVQDIPVIITHDWLALSTVGPKLPSVASSASDNESLSTEASTVDEVAADETEDHSLKATVEHVFTSIGATFRDWSMGMASASKSEATPVDDSTAARTPQRFADALPADWAAALDEALTTIKREDTLTPAVNKDRPSAPHTHQSTPYHEPFSPSKSQLWSKAHPASSSTPSRAMWQATSSSTDAEYAFSQLSEERTVPARRNLAATPILPTSPSSFLLLCGPETPRDFSAQLMWNQHEVADDRTWLDESTLKRSSSRAQL